MRPDGELAAAGESVVAAAHDLSDAEGGGSDADGRFEHELKNEQVELGTAPQTDLDGLRADLLARRRELSAAAAARGVHLLAVATSPGDGRSSTTDDARYRRMMGEFGAVGRQQLTCGMHMHVEIESPEEGVAVLDGIRAWLPLLIALSANSPYLHGEDTGYAAFRTMLWGQWPTAGPGQPFGDVGTYHALREELISSGAALDDGMLYFDARLSARYPTVEIRVADVCVRPDDSVLVAALGRALVDEAARRWRAGQRPPHLRVELLRAAQWRAARYGTSGKLFDVASGRPRPAAEAAAALVDWCDDALRASGDLERVKVLLADVITRGTGADLQRAAIARDGRLATLIADVRARMLD